MTTPREINIKPSCMSEIHGFPALQAAQLWEKISYLVTDPLPDGKLKKKLKGSEDLYRLRVGDYRVFYTFGSSWVRLLGIRRRDERTFGDRIDGMEADLPETGPAGTTIDNDLDLDAAEAEDAPKRAFSLTPEPETRLPRALTAEWLHQLRVPAAYLPILARCESEEALLAAPVPSAILERVLDNVFPRPIREVQRQPDLVVRDPTDLIKFKDGGLVSFLLKLDSDQKPLVDWALQGPTMVKGGAGTGKSTVALYRVKALLEQEPDGSGQLLFTTYTRALITASEQLLTQLLTPAERKRVRVASCDEIAREVVASVRPIGKLDTAGLSLQALRTARKDLAPSGPTAFDRRLRTRALEALSDRYLLEEFDWLIAGRGLTRLDEYLDAPRPGRGCVFRAGLRHAVWELYELFRREVARQGVERWADLRSEALRTLRDGRWTQQFEYVVVDEAQDLTPTALSLLAELAEREEGLFFAADTKQSLYSRSYGWTNAHPRLQFKGRTRTLRRNYRSTLEIDRAAFDVLEPVADEVLEPSTSVHSGPLPILVEEVPAGKEAGWAGRFIQQMSRHLRMKASASAVLVPTREIGEKMARELGEEGIPARFFPGRELDLHADVVKVLTLHSAKGLEFPVVVLAGFEPGTYPDSSDFEDQEVYLERMRNERKTLYVGMSRAMRGLMVVRQTGCRHAALDGLTPGHWHIERAP